MRSMQPSAQAQSPYEVHCNHCRVTFPVGTRRCIHCGGPLGAWAPAGEPPAALEEAAEEEPPDELSSLRKVGGVVIWGLLALAAIILRVCGGER